MLEVSCVGKMQIGVEVARVYWFDIREGSLHARLSARTLAAESVRSDATLIAESSLLVAICYELLAMMFRKARECAFALSPARC